MSEKERKREKVERQRQMKKGKRDTELKGQRQIESGRESVPFCPQTTEWVD